MKKINKIYAVCSKGQRALMAVILSAITIMVFAATVGRYTNLFQIPIAEEFSRYAVIWMAFIGIGIAGRENKHFNVPAIIDLLPARGRQVIFVFHILLMTAVTFFLIKYGFAIVQSAMKMNQISSMLQIPMWVMYITLPIGSILNWLGYLLNRVEGIIELQEEIKNGNLTKGGAVK